LVGAKNRNVNQRTCSSLNDRHICMVEIATRL
jgi:hypothetical protein